MYDDNDDILSRSEPRHACSSCFMSVWSRDVYRLCVVLHPGVGPIMIGLFSPRSRLLSEVEHISIDIVTPSRAYTYGTCRPRLSACGQCLQARSKYGFVTPRSRPALGGRGFTREVWSASCMVKNGRKSPESGIYLPGSVGGRLATPRLTYRTQQVSKPPNGNARCCW